MIAWQASTFVVLGLALAGGFAWYERSRPPSRIVALVAALAALAVAGRLALAPLPNVVATTDIALISGLSLGAAPGFVVGALAGLVSNFWLGQGPWTPWQMAGWGMAGLAGAALAAVAGRRPRRLTLAVSCALAGLAYGALADLSLMVTYGGEQSLQRYLALSARGVPFNIAHAAGNFAIALAVGPALVRMLVRFRERSEVRWREDDPPAPRRPAAARAGLTALLVGVALTAAAASAPAASRSSGRAGALAWLERAQNGDGGFGYEPGSPSSPALTGWAALGLESAGRNPLDLRRGGATPISYLRSAAGEIRGSGDLERTILVLAGAGLDSRRFAGRDLVAELRRARDGDGSFDGQVNLTAFGVLALAAADSSRGLGRSARWLRRARNADGGWGFAPGAASDPDSTGAAMQALAAAGSPPAARRAVGYLRRSQRPGGGFAIAGGAANAQSTAWAVQGLLAAGVAPGSLRRGGASPLDYLRSLQAADGHYRYSRASDQTPVWVTGQAIVAIGRRPFPLDPAPRRPAGPVAGGPEPAARPAATPSAPPRPRPPERRRRRGPVAHAAATPPAAADRDSGDPFEPASAQGDADDRADHSVAIGLGLLAVLAAGLVAGWFVYRRRLP